MVLALLGVLWHSGHWLHNTTLLHNYTDSNLAFLYKDRWKSSQFLKSSPCKHRSQEVLEGCSCCRCLSPRQTQLQPVDHIRVQMVDISVKCFLFLLVKLGNTWILTIYHFYMKTNGNASLIVSWGYEASTKTNLALPCTFGKATASYLGFCKEFCIVPVGATTSRDACVPAGFSNFKGFHLVLQCWTDTSTATKVCMGR